MSENPADNDVDCNGVEETEPFEIPELPCGRTIRFILLSTWDDPHFIGLNTIEVFTADGQRPEIESIQTNAKESMGILESLIYERRRWPCTDPQRMWTAKCDGMAEPVYVDIVLVCEQSIAMIRVWTILFTTDEAILEKIAENDVCLVDEEIMTSTLDLLNIDTDTRVATSSTPASLQSAVVHRPFTGERKKLRPTSRSAIDEKSAEMITDACSERPSDISMLIDVERGTNELPAVKVLHIELMESWGALDCIGLTGLQFLGPKGVILTTTGCHITASASPENAQRLLNGRNLTRNRDDMWLIPHSTNAMPPCITITFLEPLPLMGVCVWNYNLSPEMSYAGVRTAQFYVNGKLVAGPIILRKAPGKSAFTSLHFQQGRLPHYTVIYQLRLLSTWGDEFYVGLNGIEFYDNHDQLIKLQPQNLAAFPESVNILPTVNGDPRTSLKLIDSVNDTTSASHMWLTPVLPNRYARVFIIFDVPTVVSQIRIYNYRKTAERGVRHIAVSVDDLIVFSGEVPPSSPERTAVLAVSLRE
ncbi:unnamed protein product [Anisakis simplex]|uniref:DUF4457 domain-containing protein n=1 Tax=Anisakis simplex TaxID=6269 RepID=A0A158PNF5_ANISI|nr:unnamed protein product [Anisakis simplex]